MKNTFAGIILLLVFVQGWTLPKGADLNHTSGLSRPSTGSVSPVLGPAGVTDLRVQPLSDTSLVLTWTDAPSNTAGVLTRYVVRYDTLVHTASAFPWGALKDVLTGGCAAPLISASSAGGRPNACVLGGLKPDRPYTVRMISYTGTLNVNAVFGPFSNVAWTTTAQRVGPMLVWRPRLWLDTLAVNAVSVSDFGVTRFPLRGRFVVGDRVASFYDSTGVIAALGYLLVTRP